MPFPVAGSLCLRIVTATSTVLDYGCGPGYFVQELAPLVHSVIGIELDSGAREAAIRANRFPNVKYLKAPRTGNLPFNDGAFDVVTAFGVMEHVGREQPYIREFHRILRPGGKLVIEVPSKGPFRAFDVGNLKFNFPKLHKWYYHYVARQPEYYEATFGDQSETYGQFSREATEHKHYSLKDLLAITEPLFSLEDSCRFGLFWEFIQFSEVVVCKPLGRSRSKIFTWLADRDSRLISPFGANIAAVFSKSTE
jgi:SAM-dependent methyltransferase